LFIDFVFLEASHGASAQACLKLVRSPSSCSLFVKIVKGDSNALRRAVSSFYLAQMINIIARSSSPFFHVFDAVPKVHGIVPMSKETISALVGPSTALQSQLSPLCYAIVQDFAPGSTLADLNVSIFYFAHLFRIVDLTVIQFRWKFESVPFFLGLLAICQITLILSFADVCHVCICDARPWNWLVSIQVILVSFVLLSFLFFSTLVFRLVSMEMVLCVSHRSITITRPRIASFCLALVAW
jgi:hypothetical protein